MNSPVVSVPIRSTTHTLEIIMSMYDQLTSLIEEFEAEPRFRNNPEMARAIMQAKENVRKYVHDMERELQECKQKIARLEGGAAE